MRADITLYAKWNATNRTVTFDLNGGQWGTNTADKSVEVAYNSAVVRPGDPTKTGYTFKEWRHNGSKYEFATLVTNDVNLVAYYEINKYTVTFNAYGGIWMTDEKTETIKTVADVEYGTKISTEKKPADPAREGYAFVEWKLNGSKYDFATETVTSDITLVAKWTINTYTVTSKLANTENEADVYTTQTVTHGGKVIEPKDPTKGNAVFGGWYKEAACTNAFDFANETITDNTTIIYAKWTAVHTVTFKLETGDTAYVTQKVLDGGKVTKPSDPTKAGHTFVEWRKEGETSAYVFSTAVASDITLIAQWTENSYTVLFYDENGTTLLGAQTVTYNNVLRSDAVPAKEEHSVAWYTDKGFTQEFNLSTTITANTTLYAKWTANKYTVTFDVNGGNGSFAAQKVEYGNKATKPTPNPTKTGYTFKEWRLGGSTYSFDTPVTGEITLVAYYEINKYVVTFDANGGSWSGEPAETVKTVPNVEYNTTISDTQKPVDPTNGDKTFGGWYKNAECTEDQKFDFENDTVQANLTLYAKWEPASKSNP